MTKNETIELAIAYSQSNAEQIALNALSCADILTVLANADHQTKVDKLDGVLVGVCQLLERIASDLDKEVSQPLSQALTTIRTTDTK